MTVSSPPQELDQYKDDGWSVLDALCRGEDGAAQRRLVLEELALQPRERFLDVGCGLGHLCDEALKRVGPAGQVLGIDIDFESVEFARSRFGGGCTFTQADARAVAFEQTFDAIACVQVAEYIEDVPSFLAQIYAGLRPGGRLAILSTDWDTLAWHSDDPRRMAAVTAAWKGHCPHPRLPVTMQARLSAAGFSLLGTIKHQIVNRELDRTRHSFGLALSLREYLGRRGDFLDLDEWFQELEVLSREQRYSFSVDRWLHLAARVS